jgi:adenosylhomocysteinase
VAANFRGAYARVSVVDVNPVTRLQAHLDGFSTPPRGSVDATSCVVPVPGYIDAAIANSYLDGKYPTAPR